MPDKASPFAMSLYYEIFSTVGGTNFGEGYHKRGMLV